jgi:hypothetical protein
MNRHSFSACRYDDLGATVGFYTVVRVLLFLFLSMSEIPQLFMLVESLLITTCSASNPLRKSIQEPN